MVEDDKVIVELLPRVDEMDGAVSWVEATFSMLAAVVWGAENTTLDEYNVQMCRLYGKKLLSAVSLKI